MDLEPSLPFQVEAESAVITGNGNAVISPRRFLSEEDLFGCLYDASNEIFGTFGELQAEFADESASVSGIMASAAASSTVIAGFELDWSLTWTGSPLGPERLSLVSSVCSSGISLITAFLSVLLSWTCSGSCETPISVNPDFEGSGACCSECNQYSMAIELSSEGEYK